MSIKLKGALALTNDGWILLFNEDRMKAQEKFLAQHSEMLQQFAEKPLATHTMNRRISYLLSQMSVDVREKYVSSIPNVYISEYMNGVTTWTALTPVEKKALFLNMNLDQGEVVGVAVQLFTTLIANKTVDEIMAEYKKTFSSVFLSALLLSPDETSRDFAITKIKASNRVAWYQDVIAHSQEVYGLTFSEADNIDVLISNFRNAYSMPKTDVLKILNGHKEKLMELLTIQDNVFQKKNAFFGFASALLLQKYGDSIGPQLCKKITSGDAYNARKMIVENPHLMRYLTSDDVSVLFRKIDETLMLDYWDLTPKKGKIDFLHTLSLLRDILKKECVFFDNNIAVGARHEYSQTLRSYQVCPDKKALFNDGTAFQRISLFFLSVADMTLIPTECNHETLMGNFYTDPFKLKEDIKKLNIQHCFDGKILRKIKESSSWSDIPSLDKWLKTSLTIDDLTIDEYDLL